MSSLLAINALFKAAKELTLLVERSEPPARARDDGGLLSKSLT
jgi:hypothetical protein